MGCWKAEVVVAKVVGREQVVGKRFPVGVGKEKAVARDGEAEKAVVVGTKVGTWVGKRF